jgi:FkbM family methyltransferase
LGRYHRPPASVPRDATLILDLGANIGTTAGDFAHRFPRAQIVAVELDHATAELCRLNTRAWEGRIEVVEAAVWSESGEIKYSLEADEHWGASVTQEGVLSARALTIDDLLVGHRGGVDFLKIDIEGAERSVIKHPGDWVDRVRVMHVELHGYPIDECISDLERIGFAASPDSHHWTAVIATRAV